MFRGLKAGKNETRVTEFKIKELFRQPGEFDIKNSFQLGSILSVLFCINCFILIWNIMKLMARQVLMC